MRRGAHLARSRRGVVSPTPPGVKNTSPQVIALLEPVTPYVSPAALVRALHGHPQVSGCHHRQLSQGATHAVWKLDSKSQVDRLKPASPAARGLPLPAG